MKLEISELRDGSLILSCDDKPEYDLVFTSGAMKNDPMLVKQRLFLEALVDSANKGDIQVS